jgi:hypothetical protein
MMTGTIAPIEHLDRCVRRARRAVLDAKSTEEPVVPTRHNIKFRRWLGERLATGWRAIELFSSPIREWAPSLIAIAQTLAS